MTCITTPKPTNTPTWMTALADLQARDQWVVWRFKTTGGRGRIVDGSAIRRTKVPFDVRNPGTLARVNDPATWASYSEATDVVGFFDGIGFVFTAEDPYVGVDLDGCVAATTGEIHPEAAEVVRQLGGYVEVSPSGTGVHIIVRATLPDGCRHKAPAPWGGYVEAYDQRRFFTVSGRGSGAVQHAQEALDAVVGRLLSPVPDPGRGGRSGPQGGSYPVARATATGSDAEVLAKMLDSRQGARLGRLYQGDDSDYAGDRSRADMGWCRALAFWTGRDPDQMDRLTRSSGRMRAKWDSPRGVSTYGRQTIERAIEASGSIAHASGAHASGAHDR